MKVAKIVLEDRSGAQRDYTGWVYTVRWEKCKWGIGVTHSANAHTVLPTVYSSKREANRAAMELAEHNGAKWYSLTKGGLFTDKEWERV